MNDRCPALRHCALCHKDFHTADPTDETARAEYEIMRKQYDAHAPPGYDPNDVAVVCDACFKKVNRFFGFHAPEKTK